MSEPERYTKFKEPLTLEELRNCDYLVSGYVMAKSGRVAHLQEILPLVFALMDSDLQNEKLKAAQAEINRLNKQKGEVISALGATAWGDVLPAIRDLRDP